ncbi:hypothetical protein [Rosistilla oblonga]|uniref:hypothetical protein n=1 Tax=Rosistilla oblonga TaxID=2527990 RepID=UPI003A97B474
MKETESHPPDPNPTLLYHYERKQRHTALVLLFNMVVLFAMYGAAHKWIEPGEARDQLFYWINIAVPVVEVCLLLLAIYFWMNNGRFRMSVDTNRFTIDDPISKTYSFSVPVSEIERIRQTYRNHTNYTTTVMYLKSGETIQLTPNYSYSRRALYDALKEANPTIQLPEHPYRFKQV